MRLPDVVYLHGERKMIRLNRVKKYVGPKQDDTSFREHEYNYIYSTWSKVLNIVITILTAVATTFGLTSCLGI